MWSWFRKATVAALIAGATAVGTAVQDGSISVAEWATAVVAFVVAGAAVFQTSNTEKEETEGE